MSERKRGLERIARGVCVDNDCPEPAYRDPGTEYASAYCVPHLWEYIDRARAMLAKVER